MPQDAKGGPGEAKTTPSGGGEKNVIVVGTGLALEMRIGPVAMAAMMTLGRAVAMAMATVTAATR